MSYFSIPVSFLILVPAILGIALFMQIGIRRLYPKYEMSLNIGESGLFGLFGIAFFGAVANIFIPLSAWLAGTCIGMGVASFIYFSLREPKLRFHNIAWTILGFCLFLVPVMALRGGFSSDSGFYHIPNILWAQQFPLSLGITNLNNALGFNSIWFSAGALLAIPGMGLKSALLLNILAIAFVFAALIEYVWIGARDKAFKLSHLFALGVLASFIVLKNYIGYYAAGATPEVPNTFFTLYVIFLSLRLLENPKSWTSISLFGHSIALFAFTSRITVLFVLFFIPATLAVLAWTKAKAEKSSFGFELKRQWLPIIMISLFVILPWGVRSVMLSGCLVYPSKSTCFASLPWSGEKMASSVASSSHTFIRRANDAQLTYQKSMFDFAWVGGWIKKTIKFGNVRLSLAFVFLGLLALLLAKLSFFRRYTTFDESFRKNLTLIGILFPSLAFWFLYLPEMRYGYPFILGAGISVAILGLGRFVFVQKLFSNNLRACTVVVLLGLLSTSGLTAVKLPFMELMQKWPNFMPEVTLEKVIPEDSIPIYKSIGTDCWTSPLPCTKHLDPRLRAEKIGRRYLFQLVD